MEALRSAWSMTFSGKKHHYNLALEMNLLALQVGFEYRHADITAVVPTTEIVVRVPTLVLTLSWATHAAMARGARFMELAEQEAQREHDEEEE